MKRRQTKEMISACSVCCDERGWNENPLVYCDGASCNIAVHQACYGIVSVPKGNWYCRKCESQDADASTRCELCPFKGGALKQTDNDKWAHVVCALYIPEVKFANVTTMEPIVLSDVPKERFSEVCYICNKNGKLTRSTVGACMQCNKPGCKQQFHVTCAQTAGLLCEEAGKYLNNIKYCGYCEDHNTKVKKNVGKSLQSYESLSPHEDENTSEHKWNSAKHGQKKKYSGNAKLYSAVKKDTSSPHNLNLIINLSRNPPTVSESPGKVNESSEHDSALPKPVSLKTRMAGGAKGRKRKTSPHSDIDSVDGNCAGVDKTDDNAAVVKPVSEPNLSADPSSDSRLVESADVGTIVNNDKAPVDENFSKDDARKKKNKSRGRRKHRLNKKRFFGSRQNVSVTNEEHFDNVVAQDSSQESINVPSKCSDLKVDLAVLEDDATIDKKPSPVSIDDMAALANVEKSEPSGNGECESDENKTATEQAATISESNEAASDETKKQIVDERADAKPVKNGLGRYSRVFEELLEKQWEQAGAFLMEQAGHHQISDLLSELHQVRAEIVRQEEYQRVLIARRDHLLAVNARLSISNTMPEYTNFVANRDLQTDTEQTLLSGLSLRDNPQRNSEK